MALGAAWVRGRMVTKVEKKLYFYVSKHLFEVQQPARGIQLSIRLRPRDLCVLSCLLVTLLPRGAALAADPASEARVKELTESAHFIFRGTVQQARAANLSVVEAHAETTIVRVDEVLQAGAAVGDFTGRLVTLFSRDALRAGEQWTFFTNIQLFAESIGVREVGRLDGAVDLGALVRRVGTDLLEEQVARRMAAADLVVSGRVISTRAVSEEGVSARLTEHDPQWREAVLEVIAARQGDAVAKRVTFRYPASIDVVWAQVPKPRVGQEGTWLLHREELDAEAGDAYVIRDARHLLSSAESRLVTGMVAQ